MELNRILQSSFAEPDACDDVPSVAFFPDGKLCLTGALDRKAKGWNVASGKCLHTFRSLKEKPGESLLLNLPYCFVEHNGTLKVYKNDFENHGNSGAVEYIDIFYGADVCLKQCDFRDISVDETVRKILYQYGVEIDL